LPFYDRSVQKTTELDKSHRKRIKGHFKANIFATAANQIRKATCAPGEEPGALLLCSWELLGLVGNNIPKMSRKDDLK
jgi:hypothetical protein